MTSVRFPIDCRPVGAKVACFRSRISKNVVHGTAGEAPQGDGPSERGVDAPPFELFLCTTRLGCRDLDRRGGRRDHRVDPPDDDLPFVDLSGVIRHREPRAGVDEISCRRRPPTA
jgi:hypothetical protein